MTGKDEQNGRFVSGNDYAARGGKARAARLTPEQRSAIARLGYLAMLAKRGGDAAAAGREIARSRNGDELVYGHSEVIP